MRRISLAAVSLSAAALVAAILIAGCSEKTIAPGGLNQGGAPETEITFAPVQYDTVAFRVHFYWTGHDTDGEVVSYRWIVDPSDPAAKQPQFWPSTMATDTLLLLSVDSGSLAKQHLFMVAAVDNDGRIDPTPAVRAFSATTLPPTSKIERGPQGHGGLVGPDFTFEVSGIDPDGSQWGGIARVDSFQYLLLRLGTAADTSAVRPPWHQPLPAVYSSGYFIDLISRASGDTLPYPHGDWRWSGFRGTKIHLEDTPPGAYVFAVRAVDIAGAVETGATIGQRLRYLIVPAPPVPLPQPFLTIYTSLAGYRLNWPVGYAQGPVDRRREPLRVFEGATMSFSWSGDASAYGEEILGYDYALDDPAQIGARADPLLIGVTFGPDRLTPGLHFLYLYCVDGAGGNTLAAIPIEVLHPAFRDPGAPREILYVDDSLSPGNTTMPIGSFPSDGTETAWYLFGDPLRPLGEARFRRILSAYPSTTVTEWDTYLQGGGSGALEGRRAPGLRQLATVSTVVWVSDFNNTHSSPVALWKSLVGGMDWQLLAYLRSGGTLILTGWNLVNNSTNPSTILVNRTGGLCDSQEQLTPAQWNLTYFPRLIMGVDWVVASEDGRRMLGARDFVAAYPTEEGAALGFDTAYVDTGIPGTGAKWNTASNLSGTTSFLDLNLTPGLPRIEGWNMAAQFGCVSDAAFGREAPGTPIVRPIYRYHGVSTGVYQEGGPSPREGRIVGVLCQSHDLGPEENGTDIYDSYPHIYDPHHAVGRVVALNIPLYFLHDQQASDILFNAFTYVNGSPTLP